MNFTSRANECCTNIYHTFSFNTIAFYDILLLSKLFDENSRCDYEQYRRNISREFYFRWCLLGTSFEIYLFSWDLLLLASIRTRNGEPLTHVQMCNLLVNSYGALTELTSHVSLRAILLQVLVEEPLLKLCSTTTRAWDRQVFAVFIVRLYRKSRRI